MQGTEHWTTTVMQLGPALVDVPSQWRVQDSGKHGIVVLTMPWEDDAAMQRLQHIPGFIQPNLVFRYFPMTANQGGVARAAGDELRAALHHSPGSSLLAVTPFTTRSGLPGRAQLIVGIHQRIPFQMSRWYAGLGDTVVEIVLTLPNTFQPELLQLGEVIADSVRPDPAGSEADVTGNSSHPAIPPRRLDKTMREQLNTNNDGAHPQGELERIETILEDLDRNHLPGRGGILSASAVEHLENSVKLGSVRRFSAGPHPEDQELEALGLVENGTLSDKGRHLTSGVRDEPDIVLKGQRGTRTTEARVWIDGEEATLFLGRTGRDLADTTKSSVDNHHIHREFVISVPVILDAWTANEAAWFTDTTIECSVDELDSILAGQDVPKSLLSESSSFGKQVLSEGLTLWTASYKNSGKRFQWLRSRRRGPFLISHHKMTKSVQLTSTTASVIHDSLARLLVEDSERKAASR